MLILTATHDTNGDLAGDYDFCVEGELVYMQEPCARDLRDPHQGCGCGRGFAGASSHHATTTARVTDSPLTELDVRAALTASLEAGGWLDPRVHSPIEADQIIDEILGDIADVTAHFAVGTVVRRHLWRVYSPGVTPTPDP
jgi:hypothetical protein